MVENMAIYENSFWESNKYVWNIMLIKIIMGEIYNLLSILIFP